MSKPDVAASLRFTNGLRALATIRFAEQLAVVTLTAGGVIALFSSLRWQCSPPLAMLISLFSVFMVWLITRRAWVIFAVLGGATVGLGALRLVMLNPAANKMLTVWGEHFAAFSARSNLFYLAIAGVMLAGVFFWFARRLAQLPFALAVLGVICGAVCVWMHAAALPNRTVVLILLAVGFLILLPGVSRQRTKDLGGERGVSRTALQLTALPMVLLAASAALLIVPENAAAWRSRTLVNAVYDINDLIGYWFGGSAPSRAFELAGLGYQPLSDRLGGPISPTDKRLLRVETDRALLLRGAVEDTYSGKGWYDSGTTGRFRYDSLLFLPTRSRVLSAELPLLQNQELRSLSRSMTRTGSAEVQYLTGRNTGVFASGMITQLDTGKQFEPYFNLQAELFTDNAIPKLAIYTVTAELLDRSLPGFEDNMAQLEPAAAASGDPNWQNICAAYLVLPETLPDSVRAAALDITETAQTPYQKACAVEQWLAQNCTYTLSPGIPPLGEDFVAHFLDTREGYCVYYASAMAVLARCTGLPSRYVTGFALESTPSDHVFLATERTAHAWAEIYLYNIGWVAFDPLGFSGGLTPVPEETQDTQSAIPMPEMYTPSVPVFEGVDGAIDTKEKSFARWLWLILPLALAVGVWWMLRWLFGFAERYFRYARVTARCKDTGTSLAAYYCDMLLQLDFFELSPYTGETLCEFAPRIDRRLIMMKGRFEAVTQVYMDYLYGLKQPDTTAVRHAEKLHGEIERQLVQRLGKPVYVARRVMTLLLYRASRNSGDAG